MLVTNVTRLLVLSLALIGCRGVLSQAASPVTVPGSATPTNGRPSTTDGTPSATVTSGPTSTTGGPSPATPTASASPGASSSPQPPEQTGVWQVSEAISASGAVVSEVESTGGGGFFPDSFFALGWASDGSGDCSEATTAVLWDERDGRWSSADIGPNGNATMVGAETTPYGWAWTAVGNDGTPNCPRSGDGAAVWGSTDKSDWYRVPRVSGFAAEDVIVDVIWSGQNLIATGFAAEDEQHMGVWISRSEIDWRGARGAPPSVWGNVLDHLAMVGGNVVAVANYTGRPMWYSSNGGDRCFNSDFRPGFAFEPTDSISNGETMVVVGQACCTGPGVLAGVALSTTDGETWTLSDPIAFETVPWAVVTVRDGFLAIGRETYFSSDGKHWLSGPRLTAYEDDGQLAATSSDRRVAVVGEEGTWIATFDDLEQTMSVESAMPARRPQVGEQYNHTVRTHCGADGGYIRFDLRTWVPDPASLIDGQFPASFEDPGEQGVLTFTSADELTFVGSQGDEVRFVAVDPPPEPVLCA